MIGLDTNVLIRYLTKDDDEQWQKADRLIKSGEQCFISNIVLCEVVWVLKGKSYGFGKEEILKVLETMLHAPVFEFENRSAVYQAIQRTKLGNADFSDYLIGAICKQYKCDVTYSFDLKLKEEKGFQSL